MARHESSEKTDGMYPEIESRILRLKQEFQR